MDLINKLVKSSSFLFKIIYYLRLLTFPLFIRLTWRISNTIENKALYSSIDKDIRGCNNYIRIGIKSRIYGLKIYVRGKNNKVIIGNNCIIGKKCSFWIEGDNNTIIVGNSCTFTHTVHLCVQEYGSSINLGEDCMLSNNIIIRNSDSHPIFNSDHERINEAKAVWIAKHVWIAPQTTVMKGVTIGEGAILASNSVITKDVPKNCLAAGVLAKVVKENIYWSRERLF
ncbi:DapH/DapD/GlmU-related protein [Bacteroides helcogenes]|uniref:Acetyltransferase (Isoleucine patch superfamily)-like protein n=1 Tax=Bacteroides helcogenes (strain ATCC 35417 / DSM 20613 / JCM 6297 / CCUG 15421 / P 36-108) TaxID=693979 RepID=E6SVV8_BACT6|nr:acyltransferase [Bacteroides helcogenes]ADV44547.1 acetyltransferase (isoleucine patch superfamily)-like protein [Bacteroides helcogenes P 36-108]MDY5238975.1 acyltransferase [Bacteroides helcogenes]